MKEQTKLLVLIDGSERAILTAQYLTGFMPVGEHMRIVLFHAFSGVPEECRELEHNPECEGFAEQLRSQELEDKRDVLTCLQQVKRILVDGGYSADRVEIKFQRIVKGVARDIIEEARDGYSAVVLRRRGLGAIKNIILGSVAVKLLQALTFIPIILVGQEPPAKKLLLAVDASPPSMKAVEFTAKLLGGSGDYEARVFHAIQGLGAVRFELLEDACPEQADDAAAAAETCIKDFKARVARVLHAATAMLAESGFDPARITKMVVSGARNRADAIVTEAERCGCGTIVVGRRGLSRVDAFFMGRVSHAVVYAGKQFSVWVV